MVQVKEVKTSQRESSKPAKSTKSAKSPAKPAKAPAKSVKAPAKPAKAPSKPVKEPAKAPAKPVKEPVKAPEKPVKEPIKRTSIKITRRPPIVAKAPPKVIEPIDTAKAVAFAMSIAQEMKRNAREAAEKRDEAQIKLADRPTSRTSGKHSEQFPEKDLREFRQLLLAAREQALQGIDGLRATGFNEAEDREADGGDGTNQTLRLQALGQMGNVNRTIQQIEEALHRIDDGTYGVCTACGQLIRKPRLLNQPFVLTCMECQSEMERGAKS